MIEEIDPIDPIYSVSSVSEDENLEYIYRRQENHKVNEKDGEVVWVQTLEQFKVRNQMKMARMTKKEEKYEEAMVQNQWNADRVWYHMPTKEYDIADKIILKKVEDLHQNLQEVTLEEHDERERLVEWGEIFLNMIIDPIPDKNFNETNLAFGRTYAYAFEVFVTALLGEMYHDIHEYKVSGQSNDKGADVQGRNENGKIVEVGQVKMGSSYFKGGKGNAIALQLVGTCVYFNVKKGIIISSESKESLTPHTQDIIETVKNSDAAIKIETLFIEDIKEKLKDDNVSKAFIIDQFNKVMPKKSKTNVTFVIPCSGCDKTWKCYTPWSIRTKIYEIRRKMRDGTGYRDTDLYQHTVSTKHKINWAKADDIIEV